jgi:hypothetical protein
MSALMADHRDYADEPRQPSLFDVLAPPPTRPQPDDAEQAPEGARVVEFPRRREIETQAPEPGTGPSAAPASPSALAQPSVPATSFLEPAPAVAPDEEWLTEIAPEVDDAERTMLVPPVETEFAPEVDVAGEPRTQRAAGLPLSGPTLDDVVSRVWEGLVMGLPAACPVCHSEVLPAPPGANGGSCASCGTTID